MAAEGKVLAPLVKAMFATRGGGHGGTLPVCGMARSELTRIARMLNDADKAAGRPPVHLYVQRLFDSGTLYMDRRRLPVAREPMLRRQPDFPAHTNRIGPADLVDPLSVRRRLDQRPTETIEVPGGPFRSEDDAIDRGWEAMKEHCRASGYPLPGGAGANRDKERPDTFQLNGFYVTDANNKRYRQSHYLVVRGVDAAPVTGRLHHAEPDIQPL